MTLGVTTSFEGFTASSYVGLDCRLVVDFGSVGEVWWRGYVTDVRKVLGETTEVFFNASGYTKRLEHLAVVGLGFPIEDQAVAWLKTDLSTIAKELLDRVKVWVSASYTAESVPASGFVIDKIEFNGSVSEALRTLAELAGNSDWGIDANLLFHFRPKSTIVGTVYAPGNNVTLLEHSATTEGMVNRIYLFGGEENRFMIEDTSALQIDQSFLSQDGFISFGKATTYQKLMQSFTPTKGTMSQLDLRLRKVGFGTDLVTDGNMSAAGVASWPTLTSRTVRVKNTSYWKSSPQGLSVSHSDISLGKYGVYQNVTVTIGTNYGFHAKVLPTWGGETGGVTFELIDGTAATLGSGTVLSSYTTIEPGVWKTVDLEGVPTTTTLGIRFYANNANNATGSDPFYIDDVTLMVESDIIIDLLEWTVGFGTDDVVIATAKIPFATVSSVLTSMNTPISGYLRSGKGYGFLVRSSGAPSDVNYFETHVSSIGGYGGGEAKYYTGVVWIGAGDLIFATRLPPAQATWGVWAEVVNNPHVTDSAAAAQLGVSILAGRTSPVERARIRAVNILTRPEAVMPLGLMRAQGLLASNFLCERLAYSINEQGGITIEAELGQRMPYMADLFAWVVNRLARLEASR